MQEESGFRIVVGEIVIEYVIEFVAPVGPMPVVED
jgi:hypothetical protein